MEKEIKSIVKYFSRFSYPPDINEILLFMPKKLSKKTLARKLKKMAIDGQVIAENVENNTKYTIGEYSTHFKENTVRVRHSQIKIKKVNAYIKYLSIFPQIKLIGLSGSLAMENAKKDDDIDIFIITGKKRLWTGRLIAIFLAQVMGLRRQRGVTKAKDKICLNLFFDESGLKIPEAKKTEYVAHEILQMKPLVEKNGIYKKFLKDNSWVFDIFPNASDVFRSIKKNQNEKIRIKLFFSRQIGDFFERILGNLQKQYIKRHQTNELITQKQLWFFPEDFEKKIKNKKQT